MILHTMLLVALRATPCVMLRMMLCVTVSLAHDAVQPLSPNLSCPFLLSTSVVNICVQFWLRKKAGGFSCRSVVLGTLLLRLQVAVFELEMRQRTFRTSYLRLKTEVAVFELELRKRTSLATFARKHTRLCSRSGSCCGNALRVQLWPEPWERTSRVTFALKSCDVAALHALLYLKLANLQPKRCGSALRVLLLAAPL